ncbi:hypothetical protein NC653_017610 [Populus alba x Populus x berolinensis]|uniref:Uncharacterized protein n=1 Tax=Populus alba x Populus x berolinensis TaxID=444605 RepID=A0AAD6QQQ2_9ROSI|nr:hypothetical protein NC653_017610 [Populus alba x Populus x berolinensis]
MSSDCCQSASMHFTRSASTNG